MRKIFIGLLVLGLGMTITMIIRASQTSQHNDLPYAINNSRYQIVYLVHENVPAESPFAVGDNLAQQIGATSTTLWQRVLKFDAQRPIDALIIHESAYQLIDFSWTAAASRRGVVIAVINMHLPEIAEIINSDCLRQASRRHINPFAELNAYYYMDMGLALTDDPTEQHLAEEAVYHGCSRNPAIQSQVYGIGYATHRPLTTDGEIIALGNVLDTYLRIMYDFKQSFQNRHLPSTPVPN